VIELDSATWEERVMRAEHPVVVDFWAPWCRPCKAIRPLLEQLEQEAGGRVEFAGLDIDEYPEIAARYEVLSIPTVLLFEGGKPQAGLVGARPKGHFEREFARWITGGSAPSS
jgi:thioredoxin